MGPEKLDFSQIINLILEIMVVLEVMKKLFIYFFMLLNLLTATLKGAYYAYFRHVKTALRGLHKVLCFGQNTVRMKQHV